MSCVLLLGLLPQLLGVFAVLINTALRLLSLCPLHSFTLLVFAFTLFIFTFQLTDLLLSLFSQRLSQQIDNIVLKPILLTKLGSLLKRIRILIHRNIVASSIANFHTDLKIIGQLNLP